MVHFALKQGNYSPNHQKGNRDLKIDALSIIPSDET